MTPTPLPANVTILDLPLATTLTGAELLECVQTTGGVANSVALSVSQIASAVFTVAPANQVLAGPTSGAAAAPAFRVEVLADLPKGTTALPIVGQGVSAPAYAVLTVPGGGTGTTALAQNGIPFGNGSSTIGVTAAGNTALVLFSPGPLQSPAFGQVSLTAAVTGVLGVPSGGTNTSTLTPFGVLFGNGSATIGITAAGNTALPLVSPGPLQNPAYSVLTVPGGGLGTTTLTTNGLVVGNGSSAVGTIPADVGGKLLIAQGTLTVPAFETISQDLTIGSTGVATVTGLQSRALSSAAPATSQVLGWNGTTWLGVASSGGGSVTQVNTGWGLAGGPITATGTASIATTNPPYGFEAAVNLALTASTSGNLLTISAVGNNGATASATNPILIPFRAASIASGAPTWVTISTTLSISTFSTGATLGAATTTPFRIWIVAFYNGGSPLLGLINCSTSTNIYSLAQNALVNASSLGSTSTAAGTYYTNDGTTIAASPFCILGFAEYTAGLATPGNYASAPALQLFGPGIKKPGEFIQLVQISTTGATAVATTGFTTTTLSAVITPTSAVNLVDVAACGGGFEASSAGAIVAAQLFRSSTGIGPLAGISSATSALYTPLSLLTLDSPATTGPVTYTVRIKASSGNVGFLNTGAGDVGIMKLTEIMG